MDFKRKIRTTGVSKSVADFTKKTYRMNAPTCWLLGSIGTLLLFTAIYFGTDKFSAPVYEPINMESVTNKHVKHLVIAENSIEKQVDADKTQTEIAISTGSTGRGMSGYTFDGTPIEVVFLSVHGEKGLTEDNMRNCMGDYGQAYGIMQFDYRYDLVQFMNYAYGLHPDLWAGFQPYLSYRAGDARLVNNSDIEATFRQCYEQNPGIYLADQINRMRSRYFNDEDKRYLKDTVGIDIESRHVAVEAAFLSAEINNEKGMDWYISTGGLNSSMTDEEIIHGVYTTVRTRRSFNRFKEDGEEAVAKGLVSGTVKATDTYLLNTPWASWAPGWDGALAVQLSDQGG